MLSLACRDAGFDCDRIVRGETEEEIMKSVSEHAMKVHNMKPEDLTPELMEKIKSLIRQT
jgi:predicted small metal-binding protein